MGYNFCYYFDYLYSSLVYKLLFILEEISYLCKPLSTMEVGDYDLLSKMVEIVDDDKVPSSQMDQSYCLLSHE